MSSNGLILVGLASAARANWDVALPALGAGLDLRKIEVVDARYQQLLAQYGFRVVRYQVLPDAASPSVCFMFSESLPTRHIDFGRYVSLAGQTKPTVSVDGNQLCVQGLKNGERYSVTLRKGLPSSAVQKLGQFAEPVAGYSVQRLHVGSPAGGTLRQPRLCAAAHRAAGHPGDQRQHRQHPDPRLSHW